MDWLGYNKPAHRRIKSQLVPAELAKIRYIFSQLKGLTESNWNLKLDGKVELATLGWTDINIVSDSTNMTDGCLATIVYGVYLLMLLKIHAAFTQGSYILTEWYVKNVRIQGESCLSLGKNHW